MGDLKTQIRALQAESEEVKLNQEELNANMVSLSSQVCRRGDEINLSIPLMRECVHYNSTLKCDD